MNDAWRLNKDPDAALLTVKLESPQEGILPLGGSILAPFGIVLS